MQYETRSIPADYLAADEIYWYALKRLLTPIDIFLEQMTAKNILTQAPPYAVENAIDRLGANLRTARLRRNLTIAEVAAKIGTGPRAVADAEKGKISTGIAVYAALLWTYHLLEPMHDLANPATDTEGLARASIRERARSRTADALDNDF